MRTFLLLIGLLVFAPLALAVPIGPSGLTVLGSSSRPVSGTSDGAISAQGGNVTAVNIDALSVTNTWQGYYGNVSGNIHLDDGANKSFYVWGNGTISGEVYASRNATVYWTTVNCTNSTQRSAEETYLGVSAPDGDSVTNTFNSTTHPAFYVGPQYIAADSCYSTTGFVNGVKSADKFYQMLLSDNSSGLIYTGIIDYKQTGFDGATMDFQLLVGENEHGGQAGPTTYYFFVEIN